MAPAEPEAPEDDGDVAAVQEKLMASLGASWLTFVLATPCNALVRQHGQFTTLAVLRYICSQLRPTDVDGWLQDNDAVKEELLSATAEEIISNDPMEWLPFLLATSVTELMERYGEEVLEMLQGICVHLHEALEERRWPLPETLQYVAPAAPPEDELEQCETSWYVREDDGIGENTRLRNLGATILQS